MKIKVLTLALVLMTLTANAQQRTQITDPDAGTSTYSYTADGKLLQQTDGRGITTQNSYDALGRLTSSVCDTVTTTYTYGTSGHGKLRLEKRQSGNMSDEYTYDQYGHVTFSKRTFPDGVQMGHTYTYNSLGQLTGHQYPSNFNITYTYDDNGYRYGIWAGNAHLWRVQFFNGKVTKYHFGNTTVTDSISKAGQLLERYVKRDWQNAKLCRMAFTWNNETGNMTSRTGVKAAGVTETFTYDSLDRLTGVNQGSSTTDAITYGDDGNILSRTGMGTYGYLSSKPHAVTQVDNTDYLIASASQQIDYHPFGKAMLIREGENSQRLFYGPDGSRWLQVDSVNGQVVSKTYYDADFEMRVAGNHTHKYHYLEEGLLTYKYDSSITDHYYLLTDNVESITHIVDGEGGTVFDAGYDAWGKQEVTKNDIGFFRGYGGHEMLAQYRLVNMDGRMYDYVLGRFLSPDNYVQEPGNSQCFNRYTYCLNNPLKYNDPNGEVWWIPVLAGAIVGAYTGASIQSGSALCWHWNKDSWKGAIAGGIIGASIGYMFAGSALAPTNGLFSGAGMKTSTVIAMEETVMTNEAIYTGAIINSGTTNIAMSFMTGGGWDEAWKSGISGMITGAWAATGGFGMVNAWNTTNSSAKMLGKLGYQALGTTMESISHNWTKNKGIFSSIVLGVGPINIRFGKGEKLINFYDNIENIISNTACLVNAAFGAELNWDWENLTIYSAGGIGDWFYPKTPSGLTINAILGSSLLNDVYSHELYHLWQERAMLSSYYFNYGLNGITSLIHKGNFINYYNIYEEIPNKSLWW